MDIARTIERYDNELINSVIPFWQDHCVDTQYGGYFTLLDRDGSVYDTTKYLWMQWRIVYMFATLYTTLQRRKEWLDIAVEGFDFLAEYGKSEDGSYYFALNRRGEPAMAPFSIFSDCFAAMGAAALFKATGDERYKAEADSAMNTYLRRLDHPRGRWEKSLPGRGCRLALGHYMILANLGNVLADCLKTDEYAAATADAVDMVTNRFWNPELQVMFEHINRGGGFDLDSCAGRCVTPGHGLESMWFILQYAEKHGRTDLIGRACNYIYGLYQFGLDREYGGLYYFMDALGKPHLELQWDMKLWWVHNEALIAALYAWRLSGEDRFRVMFEELDAWTWKHFPDPEYGEWFGYLNRRGEPTHLLKGGKWKTFFHLPRGLLLCGEQLRALNERDRAE
ncbi:MAG: AGE family epimerase/isomerase [Victivallaceae bacterium]|nr:AGE family epimerase/isomerase [Victivallaceae bacterium]